MIAQIGASRIPPGIALALSGLQAELPPNAAVNELGQGLSGLHAEAMHIVGLGQSATRHQPLIIGGCLRPDGYDLKGDDIHPAGIDRRKIIGQTEPFTIVLARKMEAD